MLYFNRKTRYCNTLPTVKMCSILIIGVIFIFNYYKIIEDIQGSSIHTGFNDIKRMYIFDIVCLGTVMIEIIFDNHFYLIMPTDIQDPISTGWYFVLSVSTTVIINNVLFAFVSMIYLF
jgi:hypothetical protein